jgi:3-oxoacyl-[acyl-carrier-protein] synthase-1
VKQQRYVTSMGANTSLGTAVTACAAARAGLSRRTAFDREVADAEEGFVPLIGHPIAAVSGFEGEARLLALALPALLDLLKDVGRTPLERTGLFLALPDLATRAKMAGASLPRSVGLADRLCKMIGLPVNNSATRTFPDGPVGFALAMRAGMDWLAAGQSNTAIVGAVDSLCHDVALDALAAQDRLKGGDNSSGLQPGEGAAFLLLESGDDVRRRAAKPIASLTAIGMGKESGGDDDLPRGQGLRDAIMQLVAQSGTLPARETWFILDLNGEERRANDWGCCYPQLRLQIPDLLPRPEWYPATSFGDTGAASAALGVQMAISGFSRAYAPGPCAVVLSSSDDGRRAAIRIERAS